MRVSHVALYNQPWNIMKPIVLRILSLLLVSLLLAACAAPTERIVQTPEQTSRATRTPVSAGTAPARPQPTNTTTASDVLTLTWWTPEFISPKAPAPAGPLLAKQLADFEAAHDGKVRVNPVLKARYGKGGLLDFLRTTQPIAPGLLPDIVALDVAELEQAVNHGVAAAAGQHPLPHDHPHAVRLRQASGPIRRAHDGDSIRRRCGARGL